MKTLYSKLDSSVNFVKDLDVGKIEARFVQRSPEYFICYLSSQSGCSRGCEFCFLTAMKETKTVDLDLNQLIEQAKQVFDHYKTNVQPQSSKTVHFNFMSRGEPLMNQHISNNSFEMFTELGQLALKNSLYPKFNISTIMPRHKTKTLSNMFELITPTIYYSLYSTNELFRNKWLPGAMSVDEALSELREYQQLSKKIIKIHGAFIRDENDSIEDVANICKKLEEYKLNVEFNIVRYNPFDASYGTESPRINQIADYFLTRNYKTRIVPKVGEDVMASCGTFV